MLFFNRDLFDRSGVKPPTDAWTWDDVVESGRRLTNRDAADGATFGMANFQLNLTDSPSYSITRAFGGEWYNDGVPRTFRAAFVDPLQGKTRDRPVAIPTPPRAKDLEAIYRQEFGPVWAGGRTARDAATATRPQLDEILRTAGGR